LTDLLSEVASHLRHLRQIFENRIIESQTYLTVSEAALYLRASESTIEYLTKRTKQLAFHRVGKKMVFNRADLDAYMRRGRRAGVHG